MSRFRPSRFLAVVVSTILLGSVSAGIAKADDCSTEQSLKSPSSSEATQLSFQNRSNEKRRIYWIDQNGERKFYGAIDPGSVFQQQTYAGHAWVVTDEAEKCLYTFVASATPQTVDVGEAANVVAPPPGREVAARAQSAPPPAVDPQAVASEPVPVISPIDQFELRGLYRLIPQLDVTRALNSEATGVLDTTVVQPEWDSAQWSFEAVSGTPFVRIKNSWKKTYLADSSGTPQAIAASRAADEAEWTMEPVDGTPYVQFRNRETDRFLLAVNGAAVLVDDVGQGQENNSHWRLAPVVPGGGGGLVVAAPPPSRPLYDAALVNCREVGGIWTGSSCRRPDYMTGPLVCPRGFIWADDVGECLWDGPRCPPWQAGPGGVCGLNLACHGGYVAPGSRGYPACYCPPGAVAWGNYPRLTCVPSVARVIPLLVPAIVGGIAAGIITGGHGRPPIGQLFGNHKFGHGQIGNNTPPNTVVPVKGTGGGTCPAGTSGTPPQCVPLKPTGNSTTGNPTTGNPTSNPNPTGATCVGGLQSAGACICPQGTAPVGSGNTFTCVAGGKPSQNIPCKIGQTRNSAGDCVSIDSVVTCTGGTVAQGVCGCPSGLKPVGSGTSFKCEADKVIRQGQQTCNSGQRPATDNCLCPPSTMSVVGGVCTTTTASSNEPVGNPCAAGQNIVRTKGNKSNKCNCVAPLIESGGKCINPPTSTTAPKTCASGQKPATDNCQCPSTMSLVGGVCTASTMTKSTEPTCAVGQRPSKDHCQCPSTMGLVAGMCGGRPSCSLNEPVAKCNCEPPMVVGKGRCINPPTSAKTGTGTGSDPNCMTCDVKQVPQNQKQGQQQQDQQKLQEQKQQQEEQQKLQQQKQQEQQKLQQEEQQKLQQQKQQEEQKQKQQEEQKLQQQKQGEQQRLQQQKQQEQQKQKEQEQQKLQQQKQQEQQKQEQQQQQKQQQQQQQKQQQQKSGQSCPPPKHVGQGGRCV